MNIGDRIPEVLGIDQDGREIKASDYRGKTTSKATNYLSSFRERRKKDQSIENTYYFRKGNHCFCS